MNDIKELISINYALNMKILKPTSGGWTAAAYIAGTGTEDYFIKVYDKGRPSVQSWIARMDRYMPVVLWLYENTPLRHRMVAPSLTSNHEYKVETDQYVLLVFPMLHGETLGDTRLDREQIRQLALILAELHKYSSEIPVPTGAIEEDYSLPFLDELTLLLNTDTKPANLRNTLLPYEHTIKEAVHTLQKLAASLQKGTPHRPRNVLCHTDLHGWNLMWADKLILIDWEGLRLAPAEADLFTFTDGFFFDYAREEFMEIYQSVRKDYTENGDTMRFYRLRRRLEDIAEFAHSMIYDGLSPADTAAALQYLEKECEMLPNVL